MQIKMRAMWIERLQESLLKPAVPGDAASTGSGPFPLADATALSVRSRSHGAGVADGSGPGSRAVG